MSVPTVTATVLRETTTPERLLIVGAGLGTGVEATWSACADLVDDRTLVVGWDLPGHGRSQAHADALTIEDLATAVVGLVRSLQENETVGADVPVFYAGVSLNGCVALQLALDHADEFTGIAVVCSAAKIGEAATWRDRAAAVEREGTQSLVDGSAQRWFAPGFADAHPERVEGLLDSLREADAASYARLCEALADFDVRARLPQIGLPLLTIHGAHDPVTPPADGEAVAAAAEQVRVVALDDVAHQAPLEDPQATMAALAELMGAAR